MRSIYLENKGDSFLVHQLPIEAQFSPVYAITAIDANKDGKMDLLLAGNNAWTRIRYGRYEANHGVLLLGNGKGGFAYVPQSKSGLNIRGDVKSLLTIKQGLITKVLVGLNNDNATMLEIK